MTDTATKLARLTAAVAKLGIHFCPVCDEPHNTRSQITSDLDGYLLVHTRSGTEFCVCAKCMPSWQRTRKHLIHRKELGLSIASWILEQRVYGANHLQHEIAVELCACQDLRFDLLYWRRSHAARGVLHGHTEAKLLESLGYRWDREAQAINQSVLDYIDHVRAGGKVSQDVWPPLALEVAA